MYDMTPLLGLGKLMMIDKPHIARGRDYNGFLIGDDNYRYKEEVGTPCSADKPHIARGREYNGFLIYYV